MPPKMASFSGASTHDWVAFQVQFERIGETYNWTGEEQLAKLIECLHGKVVSFFGRLYRDERDDYQTLR